MYTNIFSNNEKIYSKFTKYFSITKRMKKK